MAPKMWGPRLIAACTACQRQHYVAADSYKPTLLTRCPTCGGSCRILPGVQPGEIVSIADPTTPADAPPQRLACVAFTLGEEPASAKRTAAQWLVKRVWGLPGERLAFRNGELWIDGVLLQKSLDELEQVAVPVARYDREPSTSRSNNTTSRPEQLGAPSMFPQTMLPSSQDTDRSQATSKFVWEYSRPARVDPRQAAREAWMVASPLMDDYAHNQGISRQLHPIGDWMLKVQWHTMLDRPITIELQTYLARVQVIVHPGAATSTRKTSASSTVEEAVISVEAGAGRVEASTGFADRIQVDATDHCTIAICDGRLLVRTALSDWTQTLDVVRGDVVRGDVVRGDVPSATDEDTAMFRLEISETELIESIELSRDLYLYWELGEPAEWLVPSDGYFVLGDNLPVSIDSRHGTEMFPRVGKLFRLSESKQRGPRQ